MKLQELGIKATAHKLNKLNESRFGFRVNYEHMSVEKAQRMRTNLDENLATIRRSYGIHQAEQNPKYMELLMVREGLTRWLEERKERVLSESELGKSEAILAAKDVVDTIQDMLEDIGRMQNEQMPALMDTIRDQIGSVEADAFSNAITPLLQNLYQNIQSAREGADKAARGLAGEQTPDMGMSGMPGAAPAMPPGPVGGMESDLDLGDEFGATDAAAGGMENLGREKR